MFYDDSVCVSFSNSNLILKSSCSILVVQCYQYQTGVTWFGCSVLPVPDRGYMVWLFSVTSTRQGLHGLVVQCYQYQTGVTWFGCSVLPVPDRGYMVCIALLALLSSTFLQTLPELVAPLNGAFFISMQLSTDAVSTLRKVWELLRLWKQHSVLVQSCT